ncbi:MAG: endonuclease Q family protein [Alicyclobacillus sp.]|nr:endonuclease Q family protein [Alicyclobacillus sp.]
MSEAKRYFGDFHIHVGRSAGRPVKMAAAPSLTLSALVDHARVEKGLDVVTVIDGTCTHVLAELQAWQSAGRLVPHAGGGLLCENGLLLIPGAEVEVAGPYGGAAHFGCWFPTLEAAAAFHDWLAGVQKNPSLSSQRASVTARALQESVGAFGGLFIVHHAFTPHKGLYGNCVARMDEMVDPSKVDALELGLSADTDMADCVSELAELPFLSDSDAHSLAKIAREYNELQLTEVSFRGVRWALTGSGENRMVANYGLHPALGKYHRTRCRVCSRELSPGAAACICGSTKVTLGVWDRLMEIRDRTQPHHPPGRPPYVHQVPLEFIPGLGPRAMRRLLDAFGTEMAVLHAASLSELQSVVGPDLADRIDRARTGRVAFETGGGGTYGRLNFLPSV